MERVHAEASQQGSNVERIQLGDHMLLLLLLVVVMVLLLLLLRNRRGCDVAVN